MDLHVSHIVMDCADPDRLADFWSRLVVAPVRTRWRQYVILEPTAPGAPSLVFQRVNEAKAAKNRAHVDLAVPDLAEATRHAVALGATVVDETTEDGVTARVLADPEGNEFCFVRLPPERQTQSDRRGQILDEYLADYRRRRGSISQQERERARRIFDEVLTEGDRKPTAD